MVCGTKVRTPRYHHLKAILAANQDRIYLEKKNTSHEKLSTSGYVLGKWFISSLSRCDILLEHLDMAVFIACQVIMSRLISLRSSYSLNCHLTFSFSRRTRKSAFCFIYISFVIFIPLLSFTCRPAGLCQTVRHIGQIKARS